MSDSTDTLIDALVTGAKPVRPRRLERLILFGLLSGGVVALAVMTVMLGLRADLSEAVAGVVFWIKSGYTILLTIAAFFAAAHLARPDHPRVPVLGFLAVPFGLLAAIAVAVQFTSFGPSWNQAALGESWQSCAVLITLLAFPLMVALTLVYRRMAPVHLRAAGTSLGALAGAMSATIYTLHCPETSLLFVAIWYTLGVAVPTIAGRFLGPLLLRW